MLLEKTGITKKAAREYDIAHILNALVINGIGGKIQRLD
jgi:hypothetical protein